MTNDTPAERKFSGDAAEARSADAFRTHKERALAGVLSSIGGPANRSEPTPMTDAEYEKMTADARDEAAAFRAKVCAQSESRLAAMGV